MTKSILPNSDPEILKPIGGFQVRWHEELDSHILYFGERRIAGHHNGYSCHALAKRALARNATSALAQFNYITACGGKHYMDSDSFIALLLKP